MAIREKVAAQALNIRKGAVSNAAFKYGTPALIGASAMHGVIKGLGETDVSSGVYELATGNPNIDEEVFGTNVGVKNLFMPLPRIFDPYRIQDISRGGYTGFMSAWDAGLLNGKMMTDVNKHNSRPLSTQSSGAPRVDGSLVFGLKNSSLA